MSLQLKAVSQNRRRSRRIHLKFPVRFWSQTHPAETLAGMTQDISASGMAFLTPKPLDISTRVKVFFDNLPGDRIARQIGGVVTRTEIDEPSGEYLVGIKFTDLDPDDRARIAAALQQTDIVGLLRLMAQKGASDLHLSTSHPTIVRIAGQLYPLRTHRLTGPELRDMVYTLLEDRHRPVFEQ